MTVVGEPADLLDMTGADLGVTDWVELSSERIEGFTAALSPTGPAAGTTGPAAGTIGSADGTDGTGASGYLLLSMVNLFLPDLLTVERFSMGVNVGLDRVRFPAEARAGDRVRARGEVVSAAEVNGGVQVSVRVTVERDGGNGSPAPEPACVADTVSRFFP